MIAHLIWAIAAVWIASLAFTGVWIWLSRETKTVKDLKLEQEMLKRDWAEKFDKLEKGYVADYDNMARRVNAVTPNMNPLGSSYSTKPQRPG